MNKKIVSLAIAAALAAPMAVSADATVFGKVRMNVNSVDVSYDNENSDATQGPIAEDQKYWEVANRRSRVGVKGSEDLGNGLSSVYKLLLETGFGNSEDEFGGDTGSISTRIAYVGLAGGFGTALIGKHYTPMRISSDAMDFFHGTVAEDYSVYAEDIVDRKADSTIAYISPSFSGLTIAAAIIPGENNDAKGLMDAYSIAAMYSNAGIYAALAFEGADEDTDAIGGNEPLSEARLSLGYDGGSFGVSFVGDKMEIKDAVDKTTMTLNGKMAFGNTTVAAKVFKVEDDENDDNDKAGFAIGAFHNLGKQTKVTLTFVSNTDDNMDNEKEAKVISLGLDKNF